MSKDFIAFITEFLPFHLKDTKLEFSKHIDIECLCKSLWCQNSDL